MVAIAISKQIQFSRNRNRRRLHRVILAAASALWAPWLAGQNPTSDLPSACAPCKGKGLIALGSFGQESRRLLQSPFPKALSVGDAREEPWIFKLTVNVDGIPCDVRRTSGPDGAFATAFVDAVMKWRFDPFMHAGHGTCYTSRLYCYLKSREGRAVVVVPGVTEPY
jgi:hypothetical protein